MSNRAKALLLIVVLVVLYLWLHGSKGIDLPIPTERPTQNQTTQTTTVATGGQAITALNSLEVKGRAPKTGYSRDQFGKAWTDKTDAPAGNNGCDTRNDILSRDLTDVTWTSSVNHCEVRSGTFHDPYTGKTIDFVRGVDTSLAVQIDHIIPLSLAWQKGASSWSPEKRATFANDPLNLMASDGPANGAKGDSDAASWLPSNKDFRCAYVARQIAVEVKYGLPVFEPEKQTMMDVLSTCPDQTIPTDSDAGVLVPDVAIR